MKLSFVIPVKDTEFIPGAKGNWQDDIALTSELGFGGIELAVRDPGMIEITALQGALKKYRIKLAAIGTGQAYLFEGLSLTDDRRPVRAEAVKRIKGHIDLAGHFASQVIIGLIKGRLGEDKTKRKNRLKYFKNSLFKLADYAYKKEAIVTVEPLNRYESDFLNQAEETINFVKELKNPNLKILLDTFHMNIEEDNICRAVLKSGSFLSHMHIADSNRRCPGEGHLDFLKIIKSLKKINYSGFLSAEILPRPDLKKAMQNYSRFFKEI